jgi:N-6 DNA Methylase
MASPTQKVLEGISRSCGRNPSEVFRSFTLMAACALSCGAREPEYMTEINRWDKGAANAFSEALACLIEDMELHPYEDRLGPLYMEVSATGDLQAKGAFYTPPALSKMIAKVTVSGRDFGDGPIAFDEPACGSGGMMLAAVEALKDIGIPLWRMQARCTDVDITAVHMCFINMVLWGVPAEVIHGNALSLEVWGVWRTPRFLKWAQMLSCIDGKEVEAPTAFAVEPITISLAPSGQLAWDLEVA